MIDLRISLQPKQREFRDSMERYPVTFYGGAKGGGKSHGMRNIFLLRRFQYPGSDGVIFRRTYPELEANHIRPLFKQFPDLKPYWNDSKKLLTLPNQSTLQFSHCKNEKDVDLYQGREIHDLGIEEAGQWTETMITRLRGSNRSSNAGIKPRTALTGNPGGIGHGYLKRLFIQKRYNERERAGDYNFIQALVSDNSALIENDPDYVRRLETEPNEALRRAFRYGDWDIFAGQFFGELSRDVHLVKPFSIPPHWPRFGAYDFGFNHPASWGWFANDEDGNVYLYRALTKAGLRVDRFAQEVLKHRDTKELMYVVAGHDCWTQRQVLRDTQGPPTVAEEFSTHGIQLRRAAIDRIQGATQVRNYLAWQELASGRSKPRFFIFDSPDCAVAYDTISRMIHDPDRVEDVLKVDATEGDPDSGDDCYDMVRYGLMSRPIMAEPARVYKHGSPEWAQQQEDQMHDRLFKQVKEEQDAAKEATNGYGDYY